MLGENVKLYDGKIWWNIAKYDEMWWNSPNQLGFKINQRCVNIWLLHHHECLDWGPDKESGQKGGAKLAGLVPIGPQSLSHLWDLWNLGSRIISCRWNSMLHHSPALSCRLFSLRAVGSQRLLDWTYWTLKLAMMFFVFSFYQSPWYSCFFSMFSDALGITDPPCPSGCHWTL